MILAARVVSDELVSVLDAKLRIRRGHEQQLQLLVDNS